MTHLSSSSFTINLSVPQYHSPEFLTFSFVISFLSILLFYGYLIFVQFYSNHRSSWISTPLNGILIWISNACNQKATFEILKFSLIVGAQMTQTKNMVIKLLLFELCPLGLAAELHFNIWKVVNICEKLSVSLFEGLNGGSACRLSVKFSLLWRSSVKLFDLCPLSVNPS